MSSDESDDFLQNIRLARLKRREALRLKQAQYGRNLPAEDLVELAELDKELAQADLAISAPTSTKFANELGTTGQFQVLTQMIENIADKVQDSADNLGERIDDRTANLGQRITTGETTSREWRVAERMANIMRDARVRAAFRWVGVFLLIIILALIVLAIVVAINATK